MTMTVEAIYTGGVLRPIQPLALDEGETVEVTVAQKPPARQPIDEDEILRRIRAARNLSEWVEATKLLPSDDGGYDIIKALNENRIFSGEHPLIPDEEASS